VEPVGGPSADVGPRSSLEQVGTVRTSRAPACSPVVLGAIGDITAAWLTDALAGGTALVPGEHVTELRAERIGAGRGLLAEVHRVAYRSSSGAAASVIVKVGASNELRQAADALGLYAREVAFYRHLAGVVPLRTPAVHATAFGEPTGDFVVVMEDLGDRAAADQLAGLTHGQVAAAVEALAPFHAWAWDAVDGLDDLRPTIPDLDCAMNRSLLPELFAAGWQAYSSHCPGGPATVLTAAAGRWPAQLAWQLSQLGTPSTLCHGDYRADNLFFAEDGALTVVDFQLVHLGCGISDVAYLVAQSTDGLDGDGHAGLVRRYVDALGRAGVRYSWQDAWRQYRVAVVFHLVEAVVATLSWPSLDSRGRDLVLRLVERTGAAIDATSALDELPGS
jgi:hypothetical protein